MKLATNRKAYFNYNVIDEYECGIILLGSEVKSIRQGNVNLVDSYAYIADNSFFIKNLKVARYKQTYISEQHDENREKKLLLNKKEISKINKSLQDKGTTLIPLEVYTSKNKIKIKLGVCKGKKQFDKRETIKQRDIERQTRADLL